MYTAKDIMNSPVVSIDEGKTLQETIELLDEHRISGVPVTDAEGKVAGIISDTDIIRYSQKINIVPKTNLSGWVSPYADVSELASMQKGMDNLRHTKAGEVMTKKVYTVSEDTNVNDVAQMMSRRKINRVPVVDKSGKLVGIVTRADMVHCLAKM